MWMMYRSGWAQKDHQEHVLAIQISRKGFDAILSKAYTMMVSHYSFQSIHKGWLEV